MPKQHIYIIACGGTIAGQAATADDLTGYQAGAMSVAELVDAVPQISEYAVIEGCQFCNIDSSDMTEDLWIRLAQHVQEIANTGRIDGIVITHGTDSMEETGYFLSLTVHADIPIVMTGSMRPATAVSADGPLNLLEAVQTAACPEAARYGVLIAMNGTLHAPRFVEKTDVTHVDAFRSRQMGCLGVIQDGKPWFYQMPLTRYTNKSAFSRSNITSLPRAAILYAYVGMDPEIIDSIAQMGMKAIVMAGLGHGRMPADIWSKVQKLMEKGVIIVRSSRTMGGKVSSVPEYAGTVCADSLTPQKAKILIQLALTKTNNIDEIQQIFQEY